MKEKNIHALWFTEISFGGGHSLSIRLNLQNEGETVAGEVEFGEGKKYQLTGRLNHNVLTFLYYSPDNNRTSQGTGTFKLTGEGEILQGAFAYYSQERDLIDTLKCTFTVLK